MFAPTSVARSIGTALLLLASVAGADAGGSIPLDEVMEQLGDNDQLISELNAELQKQNLKAQDVVCVGRRFGNHWENLGGYRAIPYECHLGSRIIEIDGELHLYDKAGKEMSLEDDDAPQRVTDYKQLNLTWSWR